MKLYPAIDMKNGKCVRLLQGREADVTVYGDDPAQMARRWASAGAKRLHLVDLDGAFSGEGKNLESIARVREAVPELTLQLGGGIRTIGDMERRFALGIDRIILGTIAVEQPDLVKEAVARWPGRIIAGIDAKNGMATVRGWVEETNVTAVELGKRLFGFGIRECIYTDISRDGMLTGPNLTQTRQMIEQTGLSIIASGGMSCMEDLDNCLNTGCAGAILGKALYDGRIDLKTALERFE